MIQEKTQVTIEPEQRYFISWSEFGRLCTKLYNDIWSLHLDGIVGIGRGGLMIATYLAHKLDVPLFSVFVRHERDGDETVTVKDLGTLPALKRGTILIVDDWVLHGHAITLVKTLLPDRVNVKTLAIVSHPDSEYTPDYVGTFSRDRVYFPYD